MSKRKGFTCSNDKKRLKTYKGNVFTSYIRSYSKSKLELEPSMSENFPVNCKFIHDSTQLNLTNLKLEYLKLKAGFKRKMKDIITDQNFLDHWSWTFFEFSSSLLLECGRF